MRKKNLAWIFVIVVLGALVGSALGEVLAYVLPQGVVKDFFLRAATVSFGPATLNLIVFTFTFGISLKINVIGVIGIGLVGYFLKWAH